MVFDYWDILYSLYLCSTAATRNPLEANSTHVALYVVLHEPNPWENIRTGNFSVVSAKGAFNIAGTLKFSVFTKKGEIIQIIS